LDDVLTAGDRLRDALNVILSDEECRGRAEMLLDDIDASLDAWEATVVTAETTSTEGGET
jgi:hypothetical protein